MNREEKYLVEQIRAGDQIAYKHLYDAYYQSLVDFVNLFSNETFFAQEVVSEFFIWLWENHESLNIKSNLSAYLYHSVKNRAFNKLKKEKKVDTLQIADEFERTDNLSPEEQMILDEETSKVENILQLLPPRTREIFIMHRYDKLKYREIAQLLEISVNTVENHIVKAIKILKAYYAKQ